MSLKEVTRHPILADLAGVVDGRSDGQSELLQALSESNGAQTGALVCFPYAGGNAVNFEPMASALRGSGLAVYAVELPGHDVSRHERVVRAVNPGGRPGGRRDRPRVV